MVNIKGPNEQPARAVGERDSGRSRMRSRSHHVRRVGTIPERGREEERFREPNNLDHLEYLARRSMLLSLLESRDSPASASANNFDMAMDRLRQQYNMNFIMICGQCRDPHVYDEITAPER